MGLRKRRKSKWDSSHAAIKHHSENDRGTVWTSQNGSSKSIANMDSNHLKNCINKIGRGEMDDRLWMLDILKMEEIYRQIYTEQKHQEENENREQQDSINFHQDIWGR